MRLIKFTHACVRVEDGDRRLLIDPGVWTEPEAFDGVTDILVTHEHDDHVDLARLAAGRFRVFAPDSVREAALAENLPVLAEAVRPVAAGDTFTAAGFPVTAVGGLHAEVYRGLPGCANLGFVVDGLYHPGDAFFVPGQPVSALLVPAGGPWFDLRSALDFVREVAPARAFPIHDRGLSADVGFDNVDGWMDAETDADYTRIPLGGSVTL